MLRDRREIEEGGGEEGDRGGREIGRREVERKRRGREKGSEIPSGCQHKARGSHFFRRRRYLRRGRAESGGSKGRAGEVESWRRAAGEGGLKWSWAKEEELELEVNVALAAAGIQHSPSRPATDAGVSREHFEALHSGDNKADQRRFATRYVLEEGGEEKQLGRRRRRRRRWWWWEGRTSEKSDMLGWQGRFMTCCRPQLVPEARKLADITRVS
eukprot:758997-Hanusia_phi.AAC.1